MRAYLLAIFARTTPTVHVTSDSRGVVNPPAQKRISIFYLHKQWQLWAAIASFLCATPSFAGYGTGTVGQVLVGLNGDHVYVQLLSPTMTNWACTAHHSLGFQFQFALSQGGGRDMLATVLTAAATGKAILMEGAGTCAWDNTLEDIQYVILQP